MRKYVLTDETRIGPSGVTLYRIRATDEWLKVTNRYWMYHDEGMYGGFVEGDHNLSHEGDAWVAYSAEVSGKALVRDNAYVTGYAQVLDEALIEGDAVICDHAIVAGKARVYGRTIVEGHACVGGRATMADTAKVSQSALVAGHAVISGRLQVAGNSRITIGHYTETGQVSTATTSNSTMPISRIWL